MSGEIPLSLKKVIKGSTKETLDLTFYIADVGNSQYDCTLTTIDLKGHPMAEGMEFSGTASVAFADGFTTVLENQTWSFKDAGVTVGEDEQEETLEISGVVLKSIGADDYAAKATVGKDKSIVLATDNWTE